MATVDPTRVSVIKPEHMSNRPRPMTMMPSASHGIHLPSPETPTRHLFRTPIVVTVGPAAHAFPLHLEILLTVSPFFAAAYNPKYTFADSPAAASVTQGTVSQSPDLGKFALPSINASDFEYFIQWLYTRTLDHEDLVGPHPAYFKLIRLYRLADQLQVTALKNAVVWFVAEVADRTNSCPTPDDTRVVWNDETGCGTSTCLSRFHYRPRTCIQYHAFEHDLSAENPRQHRPGCASTTASTRTVDAASSSHRAKSYRAHHGHSHAHPRPRHQDRGLEHIAENAVPAPIRSMGTVHDSTILSSSSSSSSTNTTSNNNTSDNSSSVDSHGTENSISSSSSIEDSEMSQPDGHITDSADDSNSASEHEHEHDREDAMDQDMPSAATATAKSPTCSCYCYYCCSTVSTRAKAHTHNQTQSHNSTHDTTQSAHRNHTHSQPHEDGATAAAAGTSNGDEPGGLRELISDLFVWKNTDRLIAEHVDQWDERFLREVIVKLKREKERGLSAPWRDRRKACRRYHVHDEWAPACD